VTAHPTGALSDVVHHRHRLGILTIASEASQVEFGYLREALDLTAGNLNRHLAVLEEAGLVETVKGYAGRRPRTWVRITRNGRKALAGEMAVLEGLVRTHRRSAARSAQSGSTRSRSAPPGSGPPGSAQSGSAQSVGGADGVDDLADHPGELEVLGGEHERDAERP
jgi:DNA-binding MarR family transcriptional regulator